MLLLQLPRAALQCPSQPAGTLVSRSSFAIWFSLSKVTPGIPQSWKGLGQSLAAVHLWGLRNKLLRQFLVPIFYNFWPLFRYHSEPTSAKEHPTWRGAGGEASEHVPSINHYIIQVLKQTKCPTLKAGSQPGSTSKTPTPGLE